MPENLEKTWIKICGITSFKDALAAVKYGADAVGFVFAESKRRIDLSTAKAIVSALHKTIMTVGIFLNERPETVRQIADDVGLDAVQLHGAESPEDCLKIGRKVIKRFDVRPGVARSELVLNMQPYEVFACLLDPGAGEGTPFDWKVVKDLPFRTIVAGGLSCENVRGMIEWLHPFGVDVSTGVEGTPGKKDHDKIQKFIEEVRHARREIQ